MADGTGPTLTYLELQDIGLDTQYGYGGTTSFSAGATDPTASIDHVELTLDKPLAMYDGSDPTMLNISSGYFTLSSSATLGTYNVVNATVYDTAGQSTSYANAQLTAAGIQTSFTIGADPGSVDNLRPILEQISMPQNILTLPSGVPVGFGVYAEDVGASGVASVSFTLDHPLETTNGPVNTLTYTSTATDGGFFYDEQIAEDVTSATPAGTYHVISATVTDNAGNVSTYTAPELTAYSFTVNAQSLAAPVLTAFQLSPVDVTNGDSNLSGTVSTSDAGGSPTTVTVTLDRPVEGVDEGVTTHGARYPVYETSSFQFGPQGQIYYGPLSQETKAGAYDITQVVVSNAAGNSTTYSASQLAADGFSTSLTIKADSTPPALTSFSLPSSPIVNGSSYTSVPMSAGVTDTGSTVGLVHATVTFDRLLGSTGGSGGDQVLIESVGNGYNPLGYFSSGSVGSTAGDFTGLTPGLYQVSSVAVTDFANNTATYSTSQLASMGDQTGFVVVQPEQFSSVLHASDGYFSFSGSSGFDQLTVNGNVWDYTLSRQAVSGASSQFDNQGDFVLTANNGGSIYYVDQSVDSIKFQDGQYLSSKDLSAYIASGASPTASAFNDDRVYQEDLTGIQALVGDSGHHVAVLNGNAQDYTERAFTGVLEPNGQSISGVELFATNGSGTIFIDATLSTVQFQNGQQVALSDIGSVVAADTSGTPNGVIHVEPETPPGDNPDFTVIGTGGGDDIALLNEPASYYQLSRGADDSFILSFGSQQITIEESVATVQFSNGQYLSLKDLPAYLYGSVTLEMGGPGNDLLFQTPSTHYELFIGGGGSDTLYLNGNTQDYTASLVQVDADTTGGDSSQGGGRYQAIELLATNGSGALFIDSSIETIQFKNGSSESWSELAQGVVTQSGQVNYLALDGETEAVSVDPVQAAGSNLFEQVFVNGKTSDYVYHSNSGGNIVLSSTSFPSLTLAVSPQSMADYYSGADYKNANSIFVQFADGQNVALRDLPFRVPGAIFSNPTQSSTLGFDAETSGPAIIPTYTGDHYILGDGQVDNLFLHGNVSDYSFRYIDSSLPEGNTYVHIDGYELVADNGSGNIYINDNVAYINFISGESVPFSQLPSLFPGQTSGFGEALTAARSGDQYLVGTNAFDTLTLNGAPGDYAMQPVNMAATDGHPAIQGVELMALNNSGNLYIDDSIEYLFFGGGSKANGPLGAVTSSLVNTVAYGSIATAANQTLIAAATGDQYFTGAGANDVVAVQGDAHDYTLSRVNQGAAGGHPAIDGYELVANNGSGDLYIDSSITAVHFLDGQYALSSLSQHVDPFHG